MVALYSYKLYNWKNTVLNCITINHKGRTNMSVNRRCPMGLVRRADCPSYNPDNGICPICRQNIYNNRISNIETDIGRVIKRAVIIALVFAVLAVLLFALSQIALGFVGVGGIVITIVITYLMVRSKKKQINENISKIDKNFKD